MSTQDRLAEINSCPEGCRLVCDEHQALLGEVERLRKVVEGAALTMQYLGQPTIRDNLLGALTPSS